jgi:glycosyltransferase involved in cell wall biosynthesis
VARNKGLAVSKGEFIQFLDGDDLLQSEKIAYQVSFLNSHTEVDIVYGSSRYFFDENKNDLYPIHFRAFAPVVEMDYRDKFQKDVLLSMNICTMCATLYRRKVIEKVNVFKPVPFEDWLFHIECSLNDFRFHYERYNDGYCLIRITEQSQMERHHRANNIKDDFFEKYRQLIYKYDYSSKLINKRSVLEGGDTKDNILLRVLNNITPPVFFKIVKFFRK